MFYLFVFFMLLSNTIVTCASTVPGDCYTFDGRITVFGPTTNAAADNLVLPAIYTLMTTNAAYLTSLNSLLIDVDMVVGDGTGSGVTTAPPVVVGTPAPQLPVIPGAPTASPAALSPTIVVPPPAGTTTLAPVPPGQTLAPAPLVAPTPAVAPATLAPVPPGQTLAPAPLVAPTPAVAPAPGAVVPLPSPAPGTATNGTSAPNAAPSTTVTSEAKTGIEKIEWWMWVLIAFGGIVVCFCGFSILKHSGRHAPLPDRGIGELPGGKKSPRTAPGTPESPYGNSGDVDTLVAPDAYVPPGPDIIVSSYPMSPSAAAPPTTTDLPGPNKGRLRPVGENEEFPDEQNGHYDDEDDEDYDDDEEGDDYDEEVEDYEDGGEEGEEGEYDDEEGEGEYDDEQGDDGYEEGDGEYADDDQYDEEGGEEEDGEYEDGDYGDEEGEAGDDHQGGGDDGGEVYEDGEEGEGDFEEYSEYDEETLGQSQEDDAQANTKNSNWGKEFVSTGGSGGSY
jgi:hypothetical protein